MTKPSFPKLVVVCGFCNKSFDLPEYRYQSYYNGQDCFYCDGECKKKHSIKKAINRITSKGSVKLSVDEKRSIRCNLIAERQAELDKFRSDNAAEISMVISEIYSKVGANNAIKNLKLAGGGVVDVDAVRLIDGRTHEMIRLHLEGVTLKDIGVRFNLTRERVRQLLKKYGYDRNTAPVRPKKDRKLFDLVCAKCGGVFRSYNKGTKSCSSDCRSSDSISSRRKLVSLKCCGCGRDFERSQYLVNISKHTKARRGYDTNIVYCTHKCYHENGNGFGRKSVGI